MSNHYTPGLDELKEAWTYYHNEVSIAEAEEEFDRTMNEFGNEMYEDGYSEGFAYGDMAARAELLGRD